MKVALVNINVRSEGPETLVGYMPPYGLLCIAGPLIDAGYRDVSLIDATIENMDTHTTADVVSKSGFDLVLLSSMASTAGTPTTLDIARRIKSLDPNVLIMTGGVHASYMFESIMGDDTAIDFVGRGEGEELCLELVKALSLGTDLLTIKGLVWRRGNELVVNDLRPAIPQDRLNLHRPAWELVSDWSRYVVPMTGERAAVVQFSRGCPFSCTFCGQWDFWARWRHRDVTTFVNELQMLRERYGVTYFFLADENPQSSSQVWYRLLEELRARDMGIHIVLNLRSADIIRDKDRLTLYREAGIVTVDLGAESAIQSRLDSINKQTSLQQNAEAIRLLREHGILSIVQTLVGFPDESTETLSITFERLRQWAPDLLHFYHVTPFPWTADGKKIEPDDILEHDFSNWDYRHQILRLKNLTASELRTLTKMFTFKYNFSNENFLKIMQIEDAYQRESMVNALFLILKNRSKKMSESTLYLPGCTPVSPR